MPSVSAPDYRQLTDRLNDSPLNPTAAEAHGILSGLLCAGAPSVSKVWVEELYAGTERGDLPEPVRREVLQALAGATQDELEGTGFAFSPLLPGDECALKERAEALYDWARGFLYGLGLAGVKQEDLSEQGREVFNDFFAITHMDLDALDEGEENEAALAELEEFVRVGAMLFYEERGRASGESRAEG